MSKQGRVIIISLIGIICIIAILSAYFSVSYSAFHSRMLEFRAPMSAEHTVELPDMQPGDLIHISVTAQQGSVQVKLLDAMGKELHGCAGWFVVQTEGLHTIVFIGDQAVFRAEIECRRLK